MLKPEDNTSKNHPQKEKAKTQNRRMINPPLVSGRRTSSIRHEASHMNLGIHPNRIEKNEQGPNGFDDECCRMEMQSGFFVVRHAAYLFSRESFPVKQPLADKLGVVPGSLNTEGE